MSVDTALRLLLFGEDKTASKALKGVGDAAGKSEGKLSKLGKGTKAAFGVMKGAIVGMAIKEVVGTVTDLTDSYAQLEDSTAAASVVFGKSMDKIVKQASTASTTMGMNKQQVIDAANVYGTYGKAAGLTGDKLAGFSTKMTQTAADMASFKGTSPEQAIEAIGAALRGETEPIRAYGVMIDDASMKQQALKMGLIKTTKEALTPQQKVLAAQALILKQTTDAQGDFARTSDSTANVGKTAAAKWTDFQTVLGEKLAPAVTAVTQAGIGLMDWLEQNPKVVEGAAAAAGLFGSALMGLWDIVRKFVLPAIVMLNEKAVRPFIQGLQHMLEGLGSIPGFEWAKTAAKQLYAVDDAIRVIDLGITDLSKDKIDTGAEVAKSEVADLDKQIKSLKGKQVEAKAKGDTKEVDRLKAKIDKLKGKKVDVQANVRKTGINGIRIRDIARGNIKISAYASGIGSAPGGLAMLGENGPELGYLAPGSRILSNGQTRAAQNQARSGASSGGDVNIYVSGDTNPNAAARRIHRSLAQTRAAYGPGWRPVKGR